MVLRVAGVALWAHTSASGGPFMMSVQAGAPQNANRGTNWPTALASLAVGAGFLALWFWLLPPWMGFRVDPLGVAGWRWVAGVTSAVGFRGGRTGLWGF